MVKAVNPGGEAQSIADLVVVEKTPDRMIEVVKTVTYNNTPNGFHKVIFLHLVFSQKPSVSQKLTI